MSLGKKAEGNRGWAQATRALSPEDFEAAQTLPDTFGHKSPHERTVHATHVSEIPTAVDQRPDGRMVRYSANWRTRARQAQFLVQLFAAPRTGRSGVQDFADNQDIAEAAFLRYFKGFNFSRVDFCLKKTCDVGGVGEEINAYLSAALAVALGIGANCAVAAAYFQNLTIAGSIESAGTAQGPKRRS